MVRQAGHSIFAHSHSDIVNNVAAGFSLRNNMDIKERKHRLPKEFYRGEISATFTLCLKGDVQSFIKPKIVRIFSDILASVIKEFISKTPFSSFPRKRESRRSGCRIKSGMTNKASLCGFINDRISILDNPVRKGLVSSWKEYPFKGTIGCEMDDVLNGII